MATDAEIVKGGTVYEVSQEFHVHCARCGGFVRAIGMNRAGAIDFLRMIFWSDRLDGLWRCHRCFEAMEREGV